MFLSVSAILIISISTALSFLSTLSNAAAAAVPLTSEGFIIPAQLQQQQSNNKNATQSPNTTDMINGLPSIDTIPIANSTSPPNEIYRYPVPGTKYILYILDCTTALPPIPLKSALTTGISAIESQIDSGSGSIVPNTFTAFTSPVSVEWYSSTAEFQCPYRDLLHLWKALRLVLLDRGSRRFPAWLFAKECDCRVNWMAVPGEPESAGGFVLKIVEGREGGLVGGGGGLGGAAMKGVGTA